LILEIMCHNFEFKAVKKGLLIYHITIAVYNPLEKLNSILKFYFKLNILYWNVYSSKEICCKDQNSFFHNQILSLLH